MDKVPAGLLFGLHGCMSLYMYTVCAHIHGWLLALGRLAFRASLSVHGHTGIFLTSIRKASGSSTGFLLGN